MLGLGWTEIILIILALVLLFGAKRLPELARGLGRCMVEFRKGVKGDEEEKPPADDQAKPEQPKNKDQGE